MIAGCLGCEGDEHGEFGNWEGYVVGSLLKDGRWIYKLSISEAPTSLVRLHRRFHSDAAQRVPQATNSPMRLGW